MQRLAILFGLILGMSGCASPFGVPQDALTGVEGVRLVLSSATFSRGEEGSVQLVNGSEDPMGYGACDPQLERLTSDGWRAVRPAEICIAILYVVPAGLTRDFSFATAELAPGLYRFRMRILPGTRLPEAWVRSPDFTVTD